MLSYVRNLLGQFDGLGDGQRARVDRAFHVDVLHLLAQICLGADKTDQAVLDLQRDVSALFDGLAQGAGCLNDKVLATRLSHAMSVYE